MIAIRRIYDFNNPANQTALVQCKEILVAQFPYLSKEEADEIFLFAKNPLAPNFRYIVLIAESRNKSVLGLAIASYFPKEKFYFLDYIAADQKRSSGGIGGALYERLREEASAAGATGIFYDCLSDDPKLCTDEVERKQNASRLRFYERYGARPLVGTKYELPRNDNSIFHLVFEAPNEVSSLKSSDAKEIIKAILHYKLSTKCPPAYIRKVIASIQGERVQQRAPKYESKEKYVEIKKVIPTDKKIGLVVNEGHTIHHIKDRGYLESPVRVNSILKELKKVDYFETSIAKHFPDKSLEEVHDKNYLRFLKRICQTIGQNDTRYGDVFPVRNAARLPADIDLQIGYYCIDTSTPLNANAYIAARAAVDCTLTAADMLLHGWNIAYSLVRPPGHHAEGKYFGGFCYLNSNAIAANYLSKKGKVVIIDIDYHHGNGQQDIFYERKDVMTISIHGDPSYAYPYFTGFDDEIGLKQGQGYNLNIPLKKEIGGKEFRKALSLAVQKIKSFDPTYLVIALGLDIAKGDPTGTWQLTADDFAQNGRILGALNPPTLVVQEGGYKNRNLGVNARHFFHGLWEGYYL